MSLERKEVEDRLKDEKLKREKEALPLEEMTLAEVGMDIPDVLAKRGWLPTDRINARKIVRTGEIRHWQTILCDALEYGFYDYAFALVATYRRKDKIGLDPNVFGSRKFDDKYLPLPPVVQIIFLYRHKPNASLDLLMDELIQAGTFLSYVKADEYYKVNAPKWGMTYEGNFGAPIDFIVSHYNWKEGFKWRTSIPLNYLADPYPKKLFVNMHFLTEDLISDRPEVQTEAAFKDLVGKEIAYHRNLFNLICDYIPFDKRLKLEETTEQFNGESDPQCKIKFFTLLKGFLLKHYEDYRKEQMEIQKAEKERWEKEEAERQQQDLIRMPSEIRALKAMVVKQGKQLSQLMSMFQQFIMRDRAGLAGASSILEHFEIELDGVSDRVKEKEKRKVKT